MFQLFFSDSSFRVLDSVQIISFKSVMSFGTNISSGYIYNLMSFHKIQIDFMKDISGL